MTTYYTAESQKFGQNISWHACKATSLSSAKSIARRRAVFQGTAIHVGVQSGNEIRRIASWYPAGDVQSGWNEWAE